MPVFATGVCVGCSVTISHTHTVEQRRYNAGPSADVSQLRDHAAFTIAPSGMRMTLCRDWMVVDGICVFVVQVDVVVTRRDWQHGSVIRKKRLRLR